MVTDLITAFHHSIYLLLCVLGLLPVYSRPNICFDAVNARPVNP